MIGPTWRAWATPYARWFLYSSCGAWPLDLFRILAGGVLAVYFADLLADLEVLTGPSGLLDHHLAQSLRPWTPWNLFAPGWPWLLKVGWGLAVILSLAIAVGIKPRFCAAALYPIAVSGFRWNYPIAYIDDVVANVLVFWLFVLPTGKTLHLPGLLRLRKAAWGSWRRATVPDLPIRLFLINVSCVYVVAGLWKWTSQYWVEGTALWVILQMPCSRIPGLLGEEWAPATLLPTWGTLVLEPILPLLLVVRRPWVLKFVGLAGMLALHAGILATMRIPYANLWLPATALLFFRRELAGALPATAGPTASVRLELRTRVAAVYVLVLLVHFAAVAVRLPQVARGLMVPLIGVGLGQGYQLFDWVDARAYQRRLELRRGDERGETTAVPLPDPLPDDLRTELLLSYVDGFPTSPFPTTSLCRLQQSVRHRIAAHLCPRLDDTATYTLHARQTWFHVDLTRAEMTTPLVHFRCPSSTVLGPDCVPTATGPAKKRVSLGAERYR